MRRAARETGFAFLAWLAPFAASVGLFPLKRSLPPLFESLMGVTLASTTSVLGCLYLCRAEGHPVVAGVRAGLLWMLANWLLDAAMFSGGPMKMSLDRYAADIGTAYLMIPAITIGLGAARSGGRLPARPPPHVRTADSD